MKVKEYRAQVEAELSQVEIGLEAAVQSEPKNEEIWQTSLELLEDGSADAQTRLTALRLLSAGMFSPTQFAPFMPRFKNALGAVAEDNGAASELRRSALDILVNQDDETARKVLTQGLKAQDAAAVPPAVALEMLARDDHASVAELAREALDSSGDPAVRQQAVRILGADPSAKDRMREILRDKNEFRDVRRAGAAALRTLDPEAFQTEAEAILNDSEDFSEIKSTLDGVLRRSKAAEHE